jgi:putative PEP-CTERM system histidine kinase
MRSGQPFMELTSILSYLAALFAGLVGVIAVFNERRSLPHWLFFGGMLACACERLFVGLSAYALLPQEIVFWQNWKWFTTSVSFSFWLAFSLTYSRGNRPQLLKKWRWQLLGSALLPLFLSTGMLGPLIVSISKKSSDSSWIMSFGLPGVLLNLWTIIIGVLILMNLERTFRASVGVMRWRIKFVIVSVGVLWAVRAYTSSQSLLFRMESLRFQALNSAALLVASLLLLRSMTRAGHFGVTVYPSSAILQSSFTLLLAGVYLVTAGALSKFANLFGGSFAFEFKAFVLLGSLVFLTLLLLSEKTRSSIKRFVSRHFHRPLYDYRIIWRNFTEGTARRLEQAELSVAVAKLVSEIFHSLSVNIWLLDDQQEKLSFGASTALSPARAAELRLEPADLALVVNGLENHPEPVDVDSSKAVWCALLRQLHPDEFRKGGNRICAPMLSGGQLLGIITLGDRVNGERFWPQDFDLLKIISEQAAASLLNIQLSQKLLQAKQVEAFQTMSAFFVHDLKNTASTLSLMLQNLPVHFNNPEFREDAFRGISRTVSHINNLINRLSLLRQDIALQSVEVDLNDLVTSALTRVESVSPIELSKDLRPLPRIRVDPAQIENVVTNLVLNAQDAVPPQGRIRVETSRQNGCIVLSVSDNGRGMTPEFVQNSLFRPFQSTKQKGIGIGMFQCKTIVEAHRGRIEVDSEVGKGTVFRVLLPVPA